MFPSLSSSLPSPLSKINKVFKLKKKTDVVLPPTFFTLQGLLSSWPCWPSVSGTWFQQDLVVYLLQVQEEILIKWFSLKSEKSQFHLCRERLSCSIISSVLLLFSFLNNRSTFLYLSLTRGHGFSFSKAGWRQVGGAAPCLCCKGEKCCYACPPASLLSNGLLTNSDSEESRCHNILGDL